MRRLIEADATTDFEETLVSVFDAIDEAPSIKTKQIKYFDEEEKAWTIGEVIVDEI